MVYLFVINLFLIGLLFFKEHQQKKIVRDILSARLSKDVYEFKEGVKEEEKKEPEVFSPEIPIEDADIDDIFKANR